MAIAKVSEKKTARIGRRPPRPRVGCKRSTPNPENAPPVKKKTTNYQIKEEIISVCNASENHLSVEGGDSYLPDSRSECETSESCFSAKGCDSYLPDSNSQYNTLPVKKRNRENALLLQNQVNSLCKMEQELISPGALHLPSPALEHRGRKLIVLGPKSGAENGVRPTTILWPKPPQLRIGKENNASTFVFPEPKPQPGKGNEPASGRKNMKRIWEAIHTDDEVPIQYVKKQKDAKEKDSFSCSTDRYFTSPYPQVLSPSETNFFGRYNLCKELGSGAFGTTHLCVEKATGLKFACKVIEKKNLVTHEDREDVRREVRIMKHLPRHENIVEFRGAYEDYQKIYVVMELCEGGELFDKIVERGFFPEDEAAITIKAIVQAIKVCHEYGVMHRDLKPENLLYADKNKSSRLKAIDFGLSTFFSPGQRHQAQLGTHCYMAPEVVKGDYSQEVDIWSAGVILYILLCGEPPFSSETEKDSEEAILRGLIDFDTRQWSKISLEAKDLVRGMLNRDPTKRLTVKQILEHPWLAKMEACNISS